MDTLLAVQLISSASSRLLPEIHSPEATALLRAIGWQESRFDHRRQIGGPARGYFQFEAIGVLEVLQNPASGALARRVLRDLDYPENYPPVMVHQALEHNDLLAVAIARLAIRRHPSPLPAPEQGAEGWAQYIGIWRPGKPHPETWADAWAFAHMPLVPVEPVKRLNV